VLRFNKFLSFGLLVVLMVLPACSLSNPLATPASTATVESVTPTNAPLPTTDQPLATKFAPTSTLVPTKSATPTTTPQVYSFSYFNSLQQYGDVTIYNHHGYTVINPPYYSLIIPGLSHMQRMSMLHLPITSSIEDAKAVAEELFPGSKIYWSGLEIDGDLPEGMMRGLPENWQYGKTPMSSWTSIAVNEKIDWTQEWVSVKGIVDKARKDGVPAESITLKYNQFGYFFVKCAEGSETDQVYPGIDPSEGFVFQNFVMPGETINFDSMCPKAVMTGSGHIFTGLKGTTRTEKQAFTIALANAFLEKLYSYQDGNGKPIGMCLLQSELGGASNAKRIWFGDMMYAPYGFLPPLEAWTTK